MRTKSEEGLRRHFLDGAWEHSMQSENVQGPEPGARRTRAVQHLPEKNILECSVQFYRQSEEHQDCETGTGFTGLSGLWESSCCRLVGGQGRLQASEVGMVGEGVWG